MRRWLFEVLAAMCSDFTFVASCFICSVAGGLLYRVNPWLWLVSIIPSLGLVFFRWLYRGRCPLPIWKAALLRRARG